MKKIRNVLTMIVFTMFLVFVHTVSLQASAQNTVNVKIEHYRGAGGEVEIPQYVEYDSLENGYF